MLEGECIKERETTCSECRSVLKLEVQHSNAGYYLGFFCQNCGPYSRESGYFKNHEQAEAALNKPAEVWERG